jgi:hypothetical protein
VYNAAGQLLKTQRAYGTSIQQDYVTYTYTLNGERATGPKCATTGTIARGAAGRSMARGLGIASALTLVPGVLDLNDALKEHPDLPMSAQWGILNGTVDPRGLFRVGEADYMYVPQWTARDLSGSRSMQLEDFQRVSDLRGETEEDTLMLHELAREGRRYIESFGWCPGIRAIYLAYAIPGVLGLFLFKFTTKVGGTDDQLWVIVGDIPSAYLVVVPPDSPQAALQRYCSLMEEWVVAVRSGSDRRNVFPVRVDPTDEHAQMLAERIDFLRREVIPEV